MVTFNITYKIYVYFIQAALSDTYNLKTKGEQHIHMTDGMIMGDVNHKKKILCNCTPITNNLLFLRITKDTLENKTKKG